jgi:hypothetical protein
MEQPGDILITSVDVMNVVSPGTTICPLGNEKNEPPMSTTPNTNTDRRKRTNEDAPVPPAEKVTLNTPNSSGMGSALRTGCATFVKPRGLFLGTMTMLQTYTGAGCALTVIRG